MSDKQQPTGEWGWAYGAGAFGGIVGFAILLVLTNDFSWPWASTGHGIAQTASYLITPVAAAYGIYLLNRRTKAVEESLQHQSIELREKQFSDAVSLLYGEIEQVRAGIALLDALDNASDGFFSDRIARILFERLQQFIEHDSEHPRWSNGMAQYATETAIAFCKCRFRHEQNGSVLDLSISNLDWIPPIDLKNPMRISRCSLSGLKFRVLSGYISFRDCEIGGCVFEVMTSINDCNLFFEQCELDGSEVVGRYLDIMCSQCDVSGTKIHANYIYLSLCQVEECALQQFEHSKPVRVQNCWHFGTPPVLIDDTQETSFPDGSFDATSHGYVFAQTSFGMDVFALSCEEGEILSYGKVD